MRLLPFISIFLAAFSAISTTPYFWINAEKQAGHNTYETRSKTLTPTSGVGPEIQLVGMIHVGEKKYYQEIKQQIQDADLVLYEGVIPNQQMAQEIHLLTAKDQKLLASCGATKNDLTHRNVATLTGLKMQLSELKLNATHHINADLENSYTSQQLQEELKICKTQQASQKERWDTLWDSPVLAGLPNPEICRNLYSLWEEADPVLLQELIETASLMQSIPNYANRVNGFAKQIQQSEFERMSQCLAADRWILHVRNDAVMASLKKHLQTPGLRKIAIVYGAMHMPDLERQIVSALGYVPTSVKSVEIASSPVDLPNTHGIYYRVNRDPKAGTYFDLRKSVWKHKSKGLKITLTLPLRAGDKYFVKELQDMLEGADQIIVSGAQKLADVAQSMALDETLADFFSKITRNPVVTGALVLHGNMDSNDASYHRQVLRELELDMVDWTSAFSEKTKEVFTSSPFFQKTAMGGVAACAVSLVTHFSKQAMAFLKQLAVLKQIAGLMEIPTRKDVAHGVAFAAGYVNNDMQEALNSVDGSSIFWSSQMRILLREYRDQPKQIVVFCISQAQCELMENILKSDLDLELDHNEWMRAFRIDAVAH